MKIFYGWIIVGIGIVVTCIGMGAMLSLSIFLQPMSQAMGWTRTGISTAALINWLAMGVGAFLWGALSDRLGTRTVLLLGGREYFGARIMGTAFGAVALVSTLGMALGPPVGGWLFDTYGSYSWLYLSSFAIGLAAVAIASTFRPPGHLVAAVPSPSLAR